ncbi:helix-turn-helix domain-containing protein [Lelliottia wanjuensis]|uniref:helix-turn-helix domain-containing protein n=1 Tax=Lelliottia wanjuensis TaxID=3050585 RepID=UPI00254C5F15|nr:LuxR C-terminal-related transcriptional regulator [Lelliottia sp. V104_15]MDK9604177.1 LuxR C-terminal-related transcriptional regulator [Lelliottia sp. V104_15]
MFICQIHYQIRNELYLAGIRNSLDKLASHNPHWGYQLTAKDTSPQDEAHFSIFDMTECLTKEAFLSHDIADQPRSMVLLKAAQKELMSALVLGSRCSILCVDEVHFNMRELIDTVMKKKRYLSVLTTRHQTITLPTSPVALTRAESMILDYLWQGRSGVDISKVLFRSEKTISTHKRSIMRKLNVTTDLELRKCIQHYENKKMDVVN